MDWDPLALSLEVAVIATLLTGIAGIGLGYLLSRRTTPARELVDAVLAAPMVLPPTVLGYYVLVALGRHSALGELWHDLFGQTIVFTVTGAVIAAAIGSLPLVVKAARSAFEQVDPTLVAAARTLGASPTRAFFTIALPLAAPGIVGGLMLGFARALGDFGVTLMIAGDIPGETQTASLAIYDAIQADRERDAATMSILITVGAVAIIYLVNKLQRRPHG
ncbi:MAG TPA: molybdate ABC transporter permease subunit [Kofleriaceae bacterium]|nr:molybdate ABC transporter permease subunit [Kofleriaceae bacterium]